VSTHEKVHLLLNKTGPRSVLSVKKAIPNFTQVY
jgi:hypothetical protein